MVYGILRFMNNYHRFNSVAEHQRDVSLQTEKYNTFNSATFMLPMKRGELILFPSNLTHSVPVNQSDEERISLSFNYMA